MTEKDLVQAAYEATFALAYRAFYDAYTSASGDKAKEADAEARFQFGVNHARHIRERALALLPPAPAERPKAGRPARQRSA